MLICISTLNIAAQEKKFKFDFYGQIRTDIFYNSRASQEMIDGLFYLYPLDKDLDGITIPRSTTFSTMASIIMDAPISKIADTFYSP